MMPNYREIYNDVFTNESRYHLAEYSPGLRAVIKTTEQLSTLNGRSLDIGCGVGFVVEYLSGPDFDFRAFGVDVSDVSIQRAKERLANFKGVANRLILLDSQTLPFDDRSFKLATCFDVLEHLDVDDIDYLISELLRVLKPGGLWMGSVSCRVSGTNDINGDNLHRTVRNIDWWVQRVEPDRIEYDHHRSQLTFWKRQPTLKPNVKPQASSKIKSEESKNSDDEDAPQSHGTADLYQRIYDENEWYGNADIDRCPGVRLFPHYRDWLIGPVMDLGCGRGHSVKKLRSAGFEADGIDQVRLDPEMKVGDIAQPISDIHNYQSAVCIDCIEHLDEEQVLGLFQNMKKVDRQAFSIHNGPSTGTGRELHVNRQSFVEWGVLIREHFEIAAAIKISEEQMLYLTKRKTDR